MERDIEGGRRGRDIEGGRMGRDIEGGSRRRQESRPPFAGSQKLGVHKEGLAPLAGPDKGSDPHNAGGRLCSQQDPGYCWIYGISAFITQELVSFTLQDILDINLGETLYNTSLVRVLSIISLLHLSRLARRLLIL